MEHRDDYIMVVDDWDEPVADTEKYHAAKQAALDELFFVYTEGSLRLRADGNLEFFSKGKWIGP